MKKGQRLERQFLVKEKGESPLSNVSENPSKLVAKSVQEKADRSTKSDRNKVKKKRLKPSLECLNLE